MPDRPTPKGITVEFKIPDHLEKPEFANFIQVNRMRSSGTGEQTILTFVSVYLMPGGGEDGEPTPAGEVVARVTLGTETAIALKELLDRQVQLLGGEPEKVPQAARPSRRAARKKRR